ncbi:uncharacterized protein LOC129774559 [Toxorhynchites rutilus septentrionalis]|uniref:uncharacterized protein LOC129774559 n=1 Tax=Toxorhynchites rutilus septentrionalis TaxID=329112 RepID=UPI002479F7CA|nr:uncharacterized protein LOC129774559 [Toxorhynchites rutilus septentrionalis]
MILKIISVSGKAVCLEYDNTKKNKSVPGKAIRLEDDYTVNSTYVNSESEGVEKSLIVIDKKLDIMNRYIIAMKNAIENISVDIQTSVKTNICANSKIRLPIRSDQDLLTLEELSKSQQGQIGLRERFSIESSESMYGFFRSIVQLLFANTVRYTWTGKSAYNAQYGTASGNASELHIVDVLIDVAQTKYHVDRSRSKTEFMRALHNFNESVASRRKRKNNDNT